MPPIRALNSLRREFDPVIVVLAVGDLVASFGFSLVFPFLTIYLTAELGASAAEAGLVLGLYSIASIGSTAAGGWLADRIGRKTVMIASTLLTSVVIVTMGLVEDLVWVAGLTLVLGVVDPPFIPAARAAVADVVPADKRPRAYGLLGVAASIGWIAGPSVGAGLSGFGYPLLFAAAGVVVGIYVVILLAAFHETRPSDAQAHGATRDELAPVEPRPVERAVEAVEASVEPAASERGAGAGPVSTGVAQAARAVLDPRWALVGFLLLVVAIHAASFQWVVTLPIHAYRDLGISTQAWGLLFALNGVLILFFQLRITSAAEGRSRPRFMAIGAAAYAAGYLVIALAPGAAPVVGVLGATVVLATIGEMFIYPLEPSFVAELSPPARRGRYQGLLGAAAGLGSAIGPPAGGAILDALPGPGVWFASAAVAGLVALGLWWLGGRTHPVEHPTVEAAEPG